MFKRKAGAIAGASDPSDLVEQAKMNQARGTNCRSLWLSRSYKGIDD